MSNTIKKFEGASLISAENGTELLVDGSTSYWSVSDDISEDAQADMDENMGPMVTATATEIATIKALSPKVREINNEINNLIREDYSVDDEFAALRTGATDVSDAIAAIVAAGQVKKEALGF